MGTWAPVLDLLEEATCPICLEYFQDPVLIPGCGHNFCQGCLARSWGNAEVDEASCPQCRQTFRPRSLLANRQLARMVEIAQRCGPPGGERWSFCMMHQEPLKLFCKNHETLICLVCDRSQEHRDHPVVPLEEAFQEYQIKVGDCLKAQKEEREKISTYGTDTEQKAQEMLDLIKKEREKTVAEFRELRRWLEEQEKLLLARMEETEKEIVARRDEGLAQHAEELCSLEKLIQEMEEKQQQPARELLQDIGSLLKKYQAKKTLENPVASLLELKWTIWDFSDISVFLKSVMKQFRGTLECGLPLQEAKVILDPGTAHYCLALSEDRKTVSCSGGQNVTYGSGGQGVSYGSGGQIATYGYGGQGVSYGSGRQIVTYGYGGQQLPSNPQRFENWFSVLGSQGFSRGRHFWEVTVGAKDGFEPWTVGVAKKSVDRKCSINPCPDDGIWEVGKWYCVPQGSLPPKYPEVHLTGNPKRIRVSLNCEGGQVAFFDAQTAALLYTFSEAPWAGETLLPSFCLWNDICLTLSP